MFGSDNFLKEMRALHKEARDPALQKIKNKLYVPDGWRAGPMSFNKGEVSVTLTNKDADGGETVKAGDQAAASVRHMDLGGNKKLGAASVLTNKGKVTLTMPIREGVEEDLEEGKIAGNIRNVKAMKEKGVSKEDALKKAEKMDIPAKVVHDLYKEEVEIEEMKGISDFVGVPDDVLQAAQRKVAKIERQSGKDMSATDTAKAIDKEINKMGYTATVSGKYVKEDLDEEWIDVEEAVNMLEEGKSSTGYELYHKDFSSAMKHAYEFAKKKYGITIDPEEIDSKVATGPKKPSEGKTNSYSLKGDKGTVQIQVYNKGGPNPYELNMYKS